MLRTTGYLFWWWRLDLEIPEGSCTGIYKFLPVYFHSEKKQPAWIASWKPASTALPGFGRSLLDLRLSQEKEQRAFSWPLFSWGRNRSNSGALRQTAGLCCILDLSSYTKTSGTKQLGANYQPAEVVSLQVQFPERITLSSSANWKTSDCLLRPRGTVQAVHDTARIRRLTRRLPKCHVLVASQGMGIFGQQGHITISEGTEDQGGCW